MSKAWPAMTPASPWFMGMADLITRPGHIPRYVMYVRIESWSSPSLCGSRVMAWLLVSLRDLHLRTFNDYT